MDLLSRITRIPQGATLPPREVLITSCNFDEQIPSGPEVFSTRTHLLVLAYARYCFPFPYGWNAKRRPLIDSYNMCRPGS